MSCVQLLQEIKVSSTDHDSDPDSNEREDLGLKSVEHHRELERRAGLAQEGYGETHPYETLKLESTASPSEVRKAYRKLSLLYHPDKNVGSPFAAEAFKGITAAYEILGDPDKRATFDDFGSSSSESFNTEEAYMKYGKKNEGNFYRGFKLIMHLSEEQWLRRVGTGNSVWIVEFYAPWCGACQSFTQTYKAVAEALDEVVGVEIGAVNCAVEARLCNEVFGIRAYPTILAVNDLFGTRQEFLNADKSVETVVAWAKTVSREWRSVISSALNQY